MCVVTETLLTENSLTENVCGLAGEKVEKFQRLKMAGVNSESDALKALGAYIGENERVSNLLLRNLRKHKTIFRRLRRMGANNVSCLILSKCVNVRQRYQIRCTGRRVCGESSTQGDKNASV